MLSNIIEHSHKKTWDRTAPLAKKRCNAKEDAQQCLLEAQENFTMSPTVISDCKRTLALRKTSSKQPPFFYSDFLSIAYFCQT
jgi:hypothetical protein